MYLFKTYIKVFVVDLHYLGDHNFTTGRSHETRNC